MKRSWKRFGIYLLLLASALALMAWITLSWILVRPTNYQPNTLQTVVLCPWPEHDAIYQATEFPYELFIENGQGALKYVGALHTSDAEEPQLAAIEASWKEFKPTVAFCEGKARMFRYAARPMTGKLSESSLVRILAYRNGIPLFSLEPTYENEVSGLLGHFEPKLVATYMTLRGYTSESSGVSVAGQNRLASSLLRQRTNVDGLRQALSSIEELDAYWNEEFPEAPDWRTLQDTESIARLREVGDVSREIRGQHMVSSIAELVSQGERVFAVVGASHVIRQETELRRLLAD